MPIDPTALSRSLGRSTRAKTVVKTGESETITAAAALVEAYLEGASVGRAAAVAEVPETTAAKTLYLLGEPIDPLTPTAKRVLEDWLAGDLARPEAKRLVGVGDAEFALGAYVATHEPIEGAEAALAEATSVPMGADPLADARSGLGDLI